MRGASGAFFFLLGLLGLPASPRAADSLYEQIPVAITLNSEAKGDFLIYQIEGGDILVRTADLERIGFSEPGGDIGRAIDDEIYLSLKGMRGVAFRLDSKSASLKIAAAPHLLATRVIDLGSRSGRVPERSANGSFFLNYGVDYRDNDPGGPRWSATGEVGARTGNLLLLTDGSYRAGEGESDFVRLMSRVIRDDRDRLQRLTFGDFSAFSGALGGSVIMGGVGFEKKMVLDPSFVFNPAFAFSGITALPAEIEISIDGIPVRKEKISPGTYDVRNFWERYGGHRQVDVTIRDIFGKETRLGEGFYFSNTLLRKGFQEYGYYAGFPREQYGGTSNRYGDLVASAFHRVGLSNTLTIGFAAEAADDLVNLGSSLSFPLGSLGEVTATGRFSSRDGADAGAGLLTYSSRWERLSWFLRAGVRGSEYAHLGSVQADDADEYSLEVGANCSLRRLGSLSLGYAAAREFSGEERHTISAALSSQLTNSLSLYTTLRQRWEEQSVFGVFVGLSWRMHRHAISARYENRDGAGATTLEASRSLPEGPGYGYRAQARRDGDRDSLMLDGQYNGPHGVLRSALSGFDADGGGGGSVVLSAAGSVTIVGGDLSLGRPVRDAFGLVQVGNLPGVRVYRNNQEIGRTDDDGTIVLPTLNSFYENQIRIEEKDIPMNYNTPNLLRYVSPAYRQGQILAFDVRRFQAVSGFLQVKNGKGPKPLEFGMGRLQVHGKDVLFPTGRAGEFYLENIPPGSYEAAYFQNGTKARCAIAIPESTETVLELGTITCTTR